MTPVWKWLVGCLAALVALLLLLRNDRKETTETSGSPFKRSITNPAPGINDGNQALPPGHRTIARGTVADGPTRQLGKALRAYAEGRISDASEMLQKIEAAEAPAALAAISKIVAGKFREMGDAEALLQAARMSDAIVVLEVEADKRGSLLLKVNRAKRTIGSASSSPEETAEALLMLKTLAKEGSPEAMVLYGKIMLTLPASAGDWVDRSLGVSLLTDCGIRHDHPEAWRLLAGNYASANDERLALKCLFLSVACGSIKGAVMLGEVHADPLIKSVASDYAFQLGSKHPDFPKDELLRVRGQKEQAERRLTPRQQADARQAVQELLAIAPCGYVWNEAGDVLPAVPPESSVVETIASQPVRWGFTEKDVLGFIETAKAAGSWQRNP